MYLALTFFVLAVLFIGLLCVDTGTGIDEIDSPERRIIIILGMLCAVCAMLSSLALR
jgi:hypothetical protein